MNRKFVIDIDLIKKCNLACDYCVIPFDNPPITHISNENLNSLIKLINDCLSDSEFLKHFKEFQISFFGGEPTLNPHGINQITDAFDLNQNVTYFIYTNGFKFKKEIYDIFLKYKDKNKFNIQISYDGLASHNASRVQRNGKGSALAVKETIYKLQELGIKYDIHPTISSANFNCLYDNYTEFKRMRETGIQCGPYSPTIDYLSKFEFNDTEIQNIKGILKEQFQKILPLTLEYYKENGYFDFGWFNPQKAICTAGNGYIGIDIDGFVIPCHGNFSSSRKESLKWGHISEITPQTLVENSLKYQNKLDFIPEACENCSTHYCLKCNAAKYEISGDWTDYTNQPGLCKIFKFIGYYKMAFMSKLGYTKFK